MSAYTEGVSTADTGYLKIRQAELLLIYNSRPSNRPLHLCGVDARHCSFAGMDLTHASFFSCDFTHANFDATKLGYTRFRGCLLDGIQGEVETSKGAVSFEAVDIDEDSALYPLFAEQLEREAQLLMERANAIALEEEERSRADRIAEQVMAEKAAALRLEQASNDVRNASHYHGTCLSAVNRNANEVRTVEKVLKMEEWEAAKPGASQARAAGLRSQLTHLRAEADTLAKNLKLALDAKKAAEANLAAMAAPKTAGISD